MIYRVKFTRDGAVSSCDPVESQLDNGHYVCYVEADNKADAITKAKKVKSAWRANRDRCRKEGFLCLRCGKASTKNRCPECAKLHTESRKQYYEFKKAVALAVAAGDQELAARLVKERSALSERISAISVASAGAVSKSNSLNRAMDPHVSYKTRAIVVFMQTILQVYDRDPAGFRVWLVAKLRASGVEPGQDRKQA